MAPVPVIEPRVDDDGDADQGNGNRHQAQGFTTLGTSGWVVVRGLYLLQGLPSPQHRTAA